MTNKDFEKVKTALVEVIGYWSERATTAPETEALAAVVQSLANLVKAQRLIQDDLPESE